MKKFNLGFILSVMLVFCLSCTSKEKSFEDDEFATGPEVAVDGSSAESEELDLSDDFASTENLGENSGSAADEFAEFEKLDDSSPAVEIAAPANPEETPEFEVPVPQIGDINTPQENVAVQPNAPELPAPQFAETPTPQFISDPEVSQNAPTGQINSLQYQANQNGGTIVINSTQPLQFTTRLNSATNQLVVEVQNSVIPNKLKRSLNTKDMASSIGSVDIYQKPKSKVARFVVQLRPGSPEPLVQPEGNSLLIVGAANPSYAKTRSGEARSNGNQGTDENVEAGTYASDSAQALNPDLASEGIMSAQSLEDFLASNNKFYGKRISIEASKLNVTEAFKFLSEESGINMIIDDDVAGDVTLKLRQVPWDQAFVLILKSKKLGYKRQGNVIRIGSAMNLVKEEDDAIKLKEARTSNEPMIVKRFFIGYADIPELEKKIKDFLSSTTLSATGVLVASPPRGKVLSDTRTGSLIVTETAVNIAKIEKLIAALDSQPQQVLIEGKVVEAGAAATDLAPASNFIRPSLSSVPNTGLGGMFLPSVGIGIPGRPGDFGNLTATLSLGESEDKLRVLSSPRISVLSNQKATISQTVNVSIDKTSTASTTGGPPTVTRESVPVGVSLEVTPQVSNEGTVVMDLVIERSFPGSASNLAAIERRNAKTKVIVRSGQTAVIGGIFQADASESVSGVPFLKDIPIFGLLFKGQLKTKNKNELVIFVTPRILKPVEGDPTSASKTE